MRGAREIIFYCKEGKDWNKDRTNPFENKKTLHTSNWNKSRSRRKDQNKTSLVIERRKRGIRERGCSENHATQLRTKGNREQFGQRKKKDDKGV